MGEVRTENVNLGGIRKTSVGREELQRLNSRALQGCPKCWEEPAKETEEWPIDGRKSRRVWGPGPQVKQVFQGGG